MEGQIDLSTPSGRLVGRLLASVARAEVEMKGARHRLANEQAARAGKPHGSRRPYGYEADLVTIRESEAAVLRAMADKIMAGWSFKEVAWWANQQGHRTSLGKLWFPITVRNMLQKKRYGGIRHYKGTDYPATWKPIFDAETWERLQLTMRLRGASSGRVEGRKFLLTGLLRCGSCGHPLNGSTKRDRAGGPLRRVYMCRVQGDTTRAGGCGKVRRNADALDDFITEAVLYRLDTPALGRLLAEQTPEDRKLSQLLSDRQAQQLRLDALVEDYATGLLSRQQLQRAKAAAERELGSLEAQIEALNRQRTATGLIPVGEPVRQAWERSESDNWRRTLLGMVIERVIVMPGITKPFFELRDGRRVRFDPSLIKIAWRA